MFDKCRYIESKGWEGPVIYVQPRKKVEKDRYFHGSVVIRNNDFSTCEKELFDLADIENLQIYGNKMPENTDGKIRIDRCGTVKEEV